MWRQNVTRPFIVCLWALIAPIVSAQELHTFSNGEVADAEKINENFQYLLGNATGSSGCSAQQDGSSVVITCADGTSGVLASAGTVVVLPTPLIGEIPDISELPTGDVVVKDANDVLLGVWVKYASGGWETRLDDGLAIVIANDEATASVNIIASRNKELIYSERDCQGVRLSFVNGGTFLENPLGGYLLRSTGYGSVFMYESYHRYTDDGWVCENFDPTPAPAGFWYLTVDVTLPAEILNAAYPIRLEQLP